MAKAPNYTAEMVETAVEMYNELGNDGIEQIAEKLQRSVRSVRSKLVREGVYIAEEKPTKTPRVLGPTKGEMLSELQSLEPTVIIDGLMGATKDGIQSVIDAFKAYAEVEDEPEGESEEV